MSEININGSTLSSSLKDLLMCDGIDPGTDPSYQICKTIYLYHPLGGKMVDRPLKMALSQPRNISIPGSPESMVKEAFEREWLALGANDHILNTMRLSRIYGVSSIVYGAEGVPTDRPIDPKTLPNLKLYFNVLDPLNTAGSLVLNQDPNAPDFLKHSAITVAGQPYHRSRACVMMNEEPIYIGYTSSAFGYVGRSVYQRALFPLKSFIQSMITDDMVTRKAGVLIAKIKAPGSIVDRTMAAMSGFKRSILKDSKTDNVISIDPTEDIETLNMQNADTAMTTARKNILENIAAAGDMPAKILNSESFAEGFGEGTEDAKDIVRYVQGVRGDMAPLFEFFDRIVKYRAWSPEFYKTVQAEFPEEYKAVGYAQAFYAWSNAFKAEWPNLIEEPDSEKAKSEDVKLKSIIAMIEVLLPNMDSDNRAILIDWAASNFNECETLLQHPLVLDIDALRDFVPPEPSAQPKEPKPFAAAA